MKALTKCFATVLVAASLITVAGCSKGSSNPKTATTANWNVRTSTSVEKNRFEFWQNNKEVAEYSISFTEGSNGSYKIDYDLSSATYKTEFYMLESYDWNTRTIEEYQTEETTTEPLYVYKTTLNISGAYQMKSDPAKAYAFYDVLETVCYFRPAAQNLQPVYSYQKVINTSPAAISTGSINRAYVTTYAVYETHYNRACTQATVETTTYESAADVGVDGKGEKTIKKLGLSGNSGHSNFDNSQLRAAVRAFSLSGGATRTFNVVTPQNGGVQSVSASVSSPVELNDTEHSTIINALKGAPEDYIFFDGTVENKKENEKDRNYRFNAVRLSINASLQGTMPVMWYTTVENNDLNTTRCVLLRMSTPLSFSMGTLDYSLKSLNVVPVE